MSASGWTMLLAVTAAALLLAPLMPAWREWRRPTDHGARRVAADRTTRADVFAMRFRAEVAAATGKRQFLTVPILLPENQPQEPPLNVTRYPTPPETSTDVPGSVKPTTRKFDGWTRSSRAVSGPAAAA